MQLDVGKRPTTIAQVTDITSNDRSDSAGPPVAQVY
jgi:hypothetical protein